VIFFVVDITNTNINIKQKQRKLTKITAIDSNLMKTIILELWDLKNTVSKNDKCKIFYPQLKKGFKTIITNSDYYSIEVIEKNCSFQMINIPYSITNDSKSNKYTSNKTFADSKDSSATIEGYSYLFLFHSLNPNYQLIKTYSKRDYKICRFIEKWYYN
jgi:hypothetical protein